MKRSLIPVLALAALAPLSFAAQPDPNELNPAVDTSADSKPAPKPAAVPAPAAAAKKPAAPTAAAKPSPTATTAAAQGKARDRLDLETTQITGNRELPRVMYVVPWKKSDLGDLGGKPANSLLDEVLTPVDRDVFQRQNRYYDALKPDAKGN